MRPLVSAFHEKLAKIGRERHAHRINRIANDPSIYHMVSGEGKVPIDFTAALRDESNILLMGQHGGVMFSCVTPGIYEAHPMVLPEGRGAWAMDMGRSALHWMFTRSDAMEIMAPVPRGNIAAKAYARALGLKSAFVTRPRWPLNGSVVPLEVHSIILQQWLVDAPGLMDRGQWLAGELARDGISLTYDGNHSALRHMGIVFECFLNGAVTKGLILHGRWARQEGYQNASLISERP